METFVPDIADTRPPSATGATLASDARTVAAPAVRGDLRHTWLLALVLVAATWLAYQPAWRAGFIWDDDAYVTENPLLSAPDGLRRIWFSTDSPSQYFPLVYTVFRAEYAGWGLQPAGYHAVNLLLHAANALLVWHLLRRLAVPGAWVAAAVFALHPLQVESVAWITELKNVLSLFFCLLALRAWLAWIGDRPTWTAYVAALGAYALALCSKTTACTLPAALLLVMWWQRRPITARRVLQVTPFVALGLAMGLLTLWWERHHQGTQGEAFARSPLDRLLIASRGLWFYLGKLVWPLDLRFSYGRWNIDPGHLSSWVWTAFTAVVATAGVCFRRRIPRGATAAAVVFVATLAPTIGFFMLYTFRYSYVADHYAYAAVIGPIAAIVGGATIGLRRLDRRWPYGATLLALVMLGALGGATWRQSRMYTDAETLWRTTLQRTPDSFLAQTNLAAVLLEKGQVDAAIEQARRALALRPIGTDLALVHLNLGNALLRRGETERGLAELRAAISAEPTLAHAHNNLGSALLNAGQDEAAKAEFERALQAMPRHAGAHYNLGHVFFRREEFAAAAREYGEAMALRPTDADAHHDLATALYLAGRADEAIAHFRTALRLRPAFASAHRNLGQILVAQGDIAAGESHLRAAEALAPVDRTRGGTP